MYTNPLAPVEAFCHRCGSHHTLPAEPAEEAGRELMANLEELLDINYLYGEARGKMFGVMVAQTLRGEVKTLKAFSGQYDGKWDLAGWVPPLFDLKKFHQLNDPGEKEIKALGRQAECCGNKSDFRQDILRTRRQLSRRLMRKIHGLYTLHNFRGERARLHEFFLPGQGIPTGTGDCCAPKLLNYAAVNEMKPLGLVEFYMGRTNKSASKHERHFYPACTEKCGFILGFLLCGMSNTRATDGQAENISRDD